MGKQYQFRDTSDTSALKMVLPTEAMNYDGVFFENRIEGYRTVSVIGRELLANELTIDTVGNRSGGKYRRSRLPIREIVVTFQLLADDETKFRNAFNQMNALLNKQQVQVWFNDEPDKYFVASHSETPVPPAGANFVTSSFTLVCSDPYKYAREEKVIDLNSQTFKLLSTPELDTYSGDTQYTFNIASLPQNRVNNSGTSVKSSAPNYGTTPAARYNLTTVRSGEKYIVEFDMEFTGQASVILTCGFATTGGSASGVMEDPHEVYVTNPVKQHVKFETTVTNVSGAFTNIYVFVVDSANSEVLISNFSMTPQEREFWYPNSSDTFTGTLIDGTAIVSTRYPFTQEMYDLINTDGGTIRFGEGTGRCSTRVIHNIRNMFAGIFPEEMQDMTDQERGNYVKAMVGRVYQKSIMSGQGVIQSTNFNVSEPEPTELLVGDNSLVNATTGLVVYTIDYRANQIIDFGAIQIGAYSVALSRGKTLILDNQGSVPTDVDFHVEHTSDNGYLSFQGSEGNGAILVGNPAEIDGVNFTQNERLVFDSFETGKESGWSMGTAYILKGGSRGQLELDRYVSNVDAWNLIYNSTNFDEAIGVNGATLTKTAGQSIVYNGTTVTGATRIAATGGTTVTKMQTKPANSSLYKLINGKRYSGSLLVKNNRSGANDTITVSIMGGSTTIGPGETVLVKQENLLANNTYYRVGFVSSAVSNPVDVTIAQAQLNMGATALTWRANYQDGFLLNNVNFAHNYVPYQQGGTGYIKFQSDKVLWNKKRSVAFVNDWRTLPKLFGAWSGAGMRKVLPADSNGVLGTANFDSRFYCGSYQADVKHRGQLQFTLDDGGARGTSLPVATVMFWKGNANDYTNISFWIRDKEVHTIRDKKFNDFTGEVKIRKEGGKFTFIVHKGEQFGPTKTNNVSAQFTYTENAEASTLIKGMNVYFANSGGAEPPVNNFVHEAQLTKLNVDKYIDTPNIFATGDICDILSTEYLVQTFVNQTMNLEIQDVGSKPIMLPVGLSQVYVDYSDFASSDIKIQAKYRERWL